MTSMNHKERLLQSGELVSHQNLKLQEARANMYSAEETAQNIQKELYRNTETIKRSIEKVNFHIINFY